MKISKLDKLTKTSNTDLYVFYVPALSDKFAVFLSDTGQTYEIKDAMFSRLDAAYKFRTNWQKANPSKGDLIIIPYENYNSINVIPVGILDNIINDFNA